MAMMSSRMIAHHLPQMYHHTTCGGTVSSVFTLSLLSIYEIETIIQSTVIHARPCMCFDIVC